MDTPWYGCAFYLHPLGFSPCRDQNTILCFFAHDSGLRPKKLNKYAFGYGDILFSMRFLGCNPQWLYDLLPNGAAGYHPYDATHVITQLEILLFSALAFTLLNLWGKYPPELPSVNLDADWVYRKMGRGFLHLGAFSGMD